MKLAFLVVIACSSCAASASAQTDDIYRISVGQALSQHHGIKMSDIAELEDGDISDSATRAFGYPGRRMGLQSGPSRAFGDPRYGRDRLSNRAWGVSIGFDTGLVQFRLAHQNKNVAKLAPAMPLGNRMDAKNSIFAANIDFGAVKAYSAYSANRGWGSSPLWNPDNPYGAALASTPSRDSRDVLVGIAMPLGATTWLASFIRKNDRDLANLDADQFAFGGTYKISRRTDAYSAFSHTRWRSGAGAMASGALFSGRGSSALNVGMRHAF